MAENLHGAFPIAMVIGGLALILCAVYLHYVALPEERTRKHVAIRATLAVGGVVLLLVGVGFLR
jgi:hypothetical protein